MPSGPAHVRPLAPQGDATRRLLRPGEAARPAGRTLIYLVRHGQTRPTLNRHHRASWNPSTPSQRWPGLRLLGRVL